MPVAEIIEESIIPTALQITCVNTMAAGLKYCDRALTVSPSYAVECCTDPEKGDLVLIHGDIVDGRNPSITTWDVGVSKNRGTPKWMVYNGKPY